MGYPTWEGGTPCLGRGYPLPGKRVPPTWEGVPPDWKGGTPCVGRGYPPTWERGTPHLGRGCPLPGKGVPPTWEGGTPHQLDGVPPHQLDGYPPHQVWTDRQTENITFPILRMRAVKTPDYLEVTVSQYLGKIQERSIISLPCVFWWSMHFLNSMPLTSFRWLKFCHLLHKRHLKT